MAWLGMENWTCDQDADIAVKSFKYIKLYGYLIFPNEETMRCILSFFFFEILLKKRSTDNHIYICATWHGHMHNPTYDHEHIHITCICNTNNEYILVKTRSAYKLTFMWHVVFNQILTISELSILCFDWR